MNAVSSVLLAVATELAKNAKDNMPQIRNNEYVKREWLENGVYNRETTFNGEVYLSQYDFRQRKSSRTIICSSIADD